MNSFTPQQIKDIRTSLKLTQSQFAARIGCSKQTVSYWEQGRRTPGGTANTAINYLVAANNISSINAERKV